MKRVCAAETTTTSAIWFQYVYFWTKWHCGCISSWEGSTAQVFPLQLYMMPMPTCLPAPVCILIHHCILYHHVYSVVIAGCCWSGYFSTHERLRPSREAKRRKPEREEKGRWRRHSAHSYCTCPKESREWLRLSIRRLRSAVRYSGL